MRGPFVRYIVAGYLTAVGAMVIVPSSALRHIPHWGRYMLAAILAAPAVAVVVAFVVLVALGAGSAVVFQINDRRGCHRHRNLPAAPILGGDA